MKMKSLKKEEGQALVEFALILPILLLLIIAVIDFGWLFMARIRVTNAAREAVRYYAVHKDTGNTEGAVETKLKAIAKESLDFVDNADLSVDASFPAGQKVSVFVTADVEPLTRLFFTTDVTISTEAHMRVEYD